MNYRIDLSLRSIIRPKYQVLYYYQELIDSLLVPSDVRKATTINCLLPVVACMKKLVRARLPPECAEAVRTFRPYRRVRRVALRVCVARN